MSFPYLYRKLWMCIRKRNIVTSYVESSTASANILGFIYLRTWLQGNLSTQSWTAPHVTARLEVYTLIQSYLRSWVQILHEWNIIRWYMQRFVLGIPRESYRVGVGVEETARVLNATNTVSSRTLSIYMSTNLSLEPPDSDLAYSPVNCQWKYNLVMKDRILYFPCNIIDYIRNCLAVYCRFRC